MVCWDLSDALHNFASGPSSKKKKTQLHELHFTGQVAARSYMLTGDGDAEDHTEGLI